MRAAALMLALLVTGCGDDVDVHEFTTCDPQWTATSGFAPQRCELACSTFPPPPAERGPGCMNATCATGDGRTCVVPRCIETFDWRGHQGCCNQGGSMAELVQFYECE